MVTRTPTKAISVVAAASLIATLLGTSTAAAAPVLPDPAPPAVTALATIDKSASAETVAPGDIFTYTLSIGCSAITDLGCRDAILTDVVPAPFVVLDATVGAGVNIAPDPVITGNTVTVDWTTPLGDGTVGILDATTGIVEITAQLPADASYDTSGVPVVNNAVIEGTNFADAFGEVAVTPVIEADLATAATKAFTPAEALAIPGTPVTATLGGGNESNATVDTLAIQDPVDPDADPNPFVFLGFTGFGTVTPPAGADPALTTYEVYVGGAWIVAPGGALPPGVDPADVRGTRVTFTGAIPAGEAASVDLALQATDAAASLTDGSTVGNTVSSTVALGADTATDDATADFTVRQNAVTVGATKSFDPELVIAGESTDVTIGAENTSSIPIDSLTIREPSSGDFPAEYTFGGFTGGVDYPAGATSGRVEYSLPGGDVESVDFADGETPALPAGVDPSDVVSFEVVFEGSITPGGETEIPFGVDTDPGLPGLPVTVTNEVAVEGENAGVTGGATANDDLYIYDERIEPYIRKQVRPSPILAVAGQVVTVSLEGGLTERPIPPDTTTGTTGRTSQVVIQDPEDPVEGDPWWNAFDLVAITQTPVPGDSTLTIEYYDTDTGTWELLSGPITGATIYSQPVPPDVQAVAGGIRFTYDYTGTDGGFAPGTDFAPNFTSSLRPDGRYVPGPPYDDDTATFVPNCAQTDASSSTPGVPDGQAVLPADECPEIELIPPDPGNEDLIDKEFGTSSSGGIKTVIARSGDTIPSTLAWGTGGYSGLDSVEITDVADPEGTDVTDSVYDAFDLFRIDAIDDADDPLMRYDAIKAVQLYNGSAWVTAVNNPCDPLCDGSFPGMDLTADERASTVGVRFVYFESPMRAATAAGDPTAPSAGSGVARSFANERQLTLVWQVRDERRSDGAPVLGDEFYNLTAVGLVRNTANATGFPQGGGDPLSADDQDDVLIVDVPITTTTDKNWQGGPLAAPADPTIPPSQFPLSRITVITRNTTPARVDVLEISDPAPGAPSNPFDAFTFNNFVRLDVPTGATGTVVTLSCFDGGSFDYSREDALALTPATIPCEVSGVSVVFTGRIASNTAGVVEFDVRLRAYWRGTTDRVSPADSPIPNTAQGIVADVDPIADCPPPDEARFACDEAGASIAIEEPSFSVTSGKTITPAQQKEDDFSPVTVTITGQPGGSARPQTLVLTDDDPTFWNAMDFVGPDPLWVLPPPVTRVQACYLDGGSFTDEDVAAGTVGGTWTCMERLGDLSVQAAIAFLDAAPSTVHGLSFQFWSTNELGWSNPVNPVINVPFFVERRVDLRTGEPTPTTRSDQVAAPGEEDAGIFFDTMTVEGTSVEVAPGQRLADSSSSEAEYRNLHLEASVNVVKSPTGDVRPGAVIPFTLAYTNTGERPLTDVVFTDELPLNADGDPQLIFNPDRDPTVPPWSFTLTGAAPVPANGAPLPTDPDEVDVQDLGSSLVFTMPGDAVLEVGQTYTITLQLVLRPGVTPDDLLTNVAAVSVAEPLDECVPEYDAASGLCYDEATIRPLAVPALSTVKSVRADVPPRLPGVPDVLSDVNGYDCEGTADADGFHRYPCVVMTLPGDTETWRFRVTNAGTLPVDRLVSIDNLPTPGDQGLIVVVPRGSVWEPTFAGGVQLIREATTPGDAQLTTYYSTSSVPCTADLNPLGTPCAAGAWTELTSDVDPALVRSVKFVVDFPDTDRFQPGESLAVQFQTRTTPGGRVDGDYARAYNTVAVGGSAINGAVDVVVPGTEGRRVGVAYPTGEIALEKIVSGPAAQYAPDSFTAQLTCTTVDGVEVTDIPEVELTPGEPVVVDGLPLGVECTATEGQFGQTQTVIGTGVVTADPAAIEVVTVENVYDVAALQVRKVVESDAVDQDGIAIEYGPFPFTVDCTFGGQAVFATGYSADDPMAESLTTAETWALGGLPVSAECTVTEVDALGATSTTMTVLGIPPVTAPGTSADVVVLEDETVQVTATNTFGVGSFAIVKQFDGAAAEDFGAGPFVFDVECALDTGGGAQSVWSGMVVLDAANGYRVEVDDVAAGAECAVEETDDGGATSSSLDPSTFVVGADGTAVVTAVNVFDAGSLAVTKAVDGEGADAWGAGPFEVALTCIDEDGAGVDIPGGETRTLDASNQYTATYDPLLIGLRCTLAETDTGGATSTTITDAEGEPLDVVEIVDGQTDVLVTNTFEIGAIEVVKTVSGAAASDHIDDVFEVSASCVWNHAAIDIPGGAVRALTVATPVRYEGLPTGAECLVSESSALGADAVTLTPADPADPTRAAVTVGAGDVATVAVDNRFDADLAPTGFDARTAWIAAMVAILLIGAGVALAGRRRREGVRS